MECFPPHTTRLFFFLHFGLLLTIIEVYLPTRLCGFSYNAFSLFLTNIITRFILSAIRPEMSIFCYVSPIQASKPTKVIGLQNEVNDKGLDEELGTDC